MGSCILYKILSAGKPAKCFGKLKNVRSKEAPTLSMIAGRFNWFRSGYFAEVRKPSVKGGQNGNLQWKYDSCEVCGWKRWSSYAGENEQTTSYGISRQFVKVNIKTWLQQNIGQKGPSPADTRAQGISCDLLPPVPLKIQGRQVICLKARCH